MTKNDAGRIDTIAICTADRPSGLERCLTSYSAHLAAHHRNTRILVFDGSRVSANRQVNRRIIGALSHPHLSRVHCIGVSDAARKPFAALRKHFDPVIVDWLLPAGSSVQSAGAVRNLVLLATAGSRVLLVDDDTVCMPWQHAELQTGVAFVGHADPRETQPFETRQAAIRAATPSNVDLLERHEALLGRSVAQLALSCGADSDLSQACAHLLPGIKGERPDWTVRATWAAVAGDAAVYCPYPLLFAEGFTRDRLAASAETFRTALSSWEVVRGVRRASVTDESWLMTYCAGIDNRQLLPPFAPEGRNEDGLFGLMLRAADPSAFIGHIPYGVVHDSRRPAGYDLEEITSASRIRLTDVVQWLVLSAGGPPETATAAARVRVLGEHLVSCGRMAPADFRHHVRALATRAKWRLLQACEICLAGAFEYPSYWRAAFARFQRAVLTSLGSARMSVPLEYQSVEIDEAMEMLRKYVDRFGRAMTIWPDLWEQSRREPIIGMER